jgi:hypothetical protein
MKNYFGKLKSLFLYNNKQFSYLIRPINNNFNFVERQIIENFDNLQINEDIDIQSIEFKGRNSRDPKRVNFL